MTDKKEHNFYKRLFLLATPIILQDFINSAVNILDTFMIGSLGVHEITAVGLANQLFFLFILVVFGINSGSSILMGQFWGNSDVKSIHKTMGLSFTGSIAAAALFSFLVVFLPDEIMGIYSKDAKVIELGVQYLRIIWISYFLSAITFSINAALKSTAQTRLPMTTTLIALFCNALLNYVFIFVFEMGVTGAAIATVLARAVELCVQLILVYVLKMPVAGKLIEYTKADKKFIKNFLVLCLPVIANEFIWALGTSAYNMAYKACGTEAQGAMQIASSLQSLFMVVGMGVGSASGIILSNMLGEGEIEKTIQYSRRIMKVILIITPIMGALLCLLSPFIINLFNVSDIVKGYAYRIIFVVAAGLVLKNFNYTTIVGILRSGGDTLFCLLIDALTVWFVAIPLAFLGAMYFNLPIYWVVALVYSEEVIKFFLSGKRVLSNVWAKKIV